MKQASVVLVLLLSLGACKAKAPATADPSATGAAGQAAETGGEAGASGGESFARILPLLVMEARGRVKQNLEKRS